MAEVAKNGLFVARIEDVMNFLREHRPALQWDADDGIKRVDWIRGGTSPGGDDMGSVQYANYYIGNQYPDTQLGGAPWRLIWVPPGPSEEQFVRPDSAGHHNRDQIGGGDPGVRPGQPPLPRNSFRRHFTRVVPTTIELWCRDFDDEDELVNWVAAGVEITNAGALAYVGLPSVQSGGTVPTHAGQRGLKYKMLVNLAFPIVGPPSGFMPGRADTTTEPVEQTPPLRPSYADPPDWRPYEIPPHGPRRHCR